jgi:TetR/AcrR family transcriptional regulator
MVNKARRTRGRPPKSGSDDVRQALLGAARGLFLKYGYRAVSSRQIAAAAGANTAMIRYYFGGKPGLYKEMLEGVISHLRARIDAMAADPARVDLGEILAANSRNWAANPWLTGLVVREVLPVDGTLRPIFLKEIAGRVVPVVEAIVTREIERGRLRADLDPRLAMLSLVSLSVFPFLAYQVTSRLFGVQLDEPFLARFITHTREVLARGLVADRSVA